MRTVMFSTKNYDRRTFMERNAYNGYGHELAFQEARLTIETAPLVEGFPAVCGFVNDVFDAAVLEALATRHVRMIALRSAGFNNVDLRAANRCGITVCRVPGYSPHSVAEFTVGLIISLVRSIHRAYLRTRANNCPRRLVRLQSAWAHHRSNRHRPDRRAGRTHDGRRVWLPRTRA